MESASSSSSSDDEDVINFLEHLNRPRAERIYRNRINHFTKWNDIEFYQRFRLSKHIVHIILELIQEDLQSLTNRNHAVTPEEKLLLTLRFMATNNFLISAGDFVGIHKTTAGKYIWQVLQAIAQHILEYICFPQEENSITKSKKDFYKISCMPNVLGAIDCTHIKIESPGGAQAETFRNRKGFFSLNVQAICNAKLQFIDIVARWPGSAHDSRIFANSRIKEKFENGNFGNSILVADSGYSTKRYCLTPLNNPTTQRETIYNEAQIRTRNVIERAFGVLKRRFPVLSLGIRLSLRKVQCIVVVAAILHNIAIQFNEEEPPPLPENIEQAILDTNVDDVNNNNDGRHFHPCIIPYLNYFENL